MDGRYFVGEWLVEPEQNRLVRGKERVKLDPKAVRVLSLLADHPKELLTKEQIIDAVWHGAFVSDEVLTTAVWSLRKAFGDDAKEPRYIKTVPRQGYQLIAPVERASAESARGWKSSPYPGLAAFGPRDAEFFFGREEELEALWGKLERQPLIGLIGPSGAGKSSLVRAGLIPRAPEGWDVFLYRPRNEAFDRMTSALTARRDDERRVLWVIDPFEELFTLHDRETQARFARLLGTAAEQGIHVLLSMRDDFLIRCHDHEELAPVFHDLTPIKALEGAALRKALVEPARACGYRFEDDALVAEILAEVMKEPGALPLLAFAASRLWEKRDRENHLLTREAYLSIGGVAGALAQHAERVMSGIGTEHHAMVREIFRNLVTASATRVPMNREELLSVFSDRDRAEEILGKLVDERLLTSSEGEVEILHESLLTAWPRLVRWHAQDAEGAILRDQLRQAVRTWQERGRPQDLLWTGTSYRELALLREHYGGGLTAMEEEFAEAVTKLAGRRRKRRRAAVVAAFAVLLAVVGVVTSLWRRSVHEVSRREAAQILSLGRLDLENNPTKALAHSLASLEQADSEAARRFAVQALWHGAQAYVLTDNVNDFDFSPDGQWLATAGVRSPGARLWSIDGGPPRALGESDEARGVGALGFSPTGDFLAAGTNDAVRFWSLTDGSLLREYELGRPSYFERKKTHLWSQSWTSDTKTALREWRSPDELPDVSSVVDDFHPDDASAWNIDASERWFVRARDNAVYLSPLQDSGPERTRLIGKHDARVVWTAAHPTESRIVSGDESGEVRLWSFSATSSHLERRFRMPASEACCTSRSMALVDETSSSILFSVWGPHSTSAVAYLSSLTGPPDVEPRVLRNGDATWVNILGFGPHGDWIFTAHDTFAVLWPVHGKYSRVLRGQAPPFIQVAFTPDGRGLVSTSDEGIVRLWPLAFKENEHTRILMEDKTALLGVRLGVDPSGQHLLVGSRFDPRVFLVSLDGRGPHEMPGLLRGQGGVGAFAFSLEGRFAAVGMVRPPSIRLWDLETGKVDAFDPTVPEECAQDDRWKGLVDGMEFLADGRLLTFGVGGLRIWGLENATSEPIVACTAGPDPDRRMTLATDARHARFLLLEWNEVTRFSNLRSLDLDTRELREITSHGNRVSAVALDPTGTTIVTGDVEGVVRVGPASGAAPHLLYGHTLAVSSVAVSPDGKWIASASQDGTIRLWPMPEGTPLHTLPYEELLERLRRLTNLRVVPDESSATGYRVEVGPFPGWKTVPTW